jgi:hypothetical protein
VIAVTVHGRVRDEVVEMRVVRETRRVGDRRGIVQEFPEESERRRLFQSHRTELTDLDLERLRLVVKRPDGSVQLRFEELECVVHRQPSAERLARRLPKLAQLRPSSHDMRCFVGSDAPQGVLMDACDRRRDRL